METKKKSIRTSGPKEVKTNLNRRSVEELKKAGFTMPSNEQMILGDDRYYDMDTHRTYRNNNVLVVGASGAGKTRSIVTPNLLQANGSYIISDPKGNLFDRYALYLKSKGYEIKRLDFTDPGHSDHYNFFRYIRSYQDIVKLSHMLIFQHKNVNSKMDPFWDEAAQLLIQSLMGFLWETMPKNEQNYHNLMELLELFFVSGDMTEEVAPIDTIFQDLEKCNKDSYALKCYRKFRIAADKTLRSILISANARLGLFDTPDLCAMMSEDTINISSIGKKKTALFVVVSDTDRSLDVLVNMFFTQAMNELCLYADKHCKDNVLPVPVRFIMDDFATNCRIEDFPRMIASIRSRGISAMMMIQAESQLEEGYGEDGRTIIGNCDTYVYLGCNDLSTAREVAERCDIPVKRILNMPINTNWILRRGEAPTQGKNFPLETYLEAKGLSRLDVYHR